MSEITITTGSSIRARCPTAWDGTSSRTEQLQHLPELRSNGYYEKSYEQVDNYAEQSMMSYLFAEDAPGLASYYLLAVLLQALQSGEPLRGLRQGREPR